jgi:hypothetical protein
MNCDHLEAECATGITIELFMAWNVACVLANAESGTSFAQTLSSTRSSHIFKTISMSVPMYGRQGFVVENVSEKGRSVDCEKSEHLLPLYMFPFDAHQATISLFSHVVGTLVRLDQIRSHPSLGILHRDSRDTTVELERSAAR